tara:strand:+ start:20992 stop:21669 length:678 start_codon:yes stop_codon:yes gene_type:complete
MKYFIISLLTMFSVFAADFCPTEYENLILAQDKTDKSQLVQELKEDTVLLKQAIHKIKNYQKVFQLLKNQYSRHEVMVEIQHNQSLIDALKFEIKRNKTLLKKDVKADDQVLKISECRKELIQNKLERNQLVKNKDKLCHQAAKLHIFSLSCAVKAARNGLESDKLQACADSTTLHTSFLNCLDLASELNKHEIHQCGKVTTPTDYQACLHGHLTPLYPKSKNTL